MKEINKLSIIGGARALSGSIVWPFIGFALYDVYHFSFTFISIFYIFQGLVSIFAYIMGGYFTDFMGRVRVMILSSILSSFSLFLAFLINYSLVVAGLILIQTFFNSAYNVANTSLVGDLNRGFGGLVRAFSRIRVGINAGWAAGPVIGGFIFSFIGFRPILLISSLISLISIPLLLHFPDFKGKIEVSFHADKNFIKFLIPTFLTFMVMGQLGFSLLTFYDVVDKINTFQVGLLFMINGILIVILQEFIGRKLTSKMISLGMIIYSASYFAVAFVSNFVLASIDMVFITLAEMIVSPLSQAIASSLSENNTRGRSMGIYGMVTALGRVSGSSFSGYLMNFFLFTPTILWGSVALLGIISAILYLFLTPFKIIKY
ncbi:MFS transporter [Acidianus brierleyi]|uniref:MFS transporter n=1 Tax=Acidianus brierleyi TaxID=41673 RepID=UPI001443399B|nr:MFS transporter [Acidianus brierleyi]QIJ32853.1 MFS transporter [Acidianus brierleyi]